MPNFPDFFILGAPKCGTTTLASWLKEHDRIFMPGIKEPHYYNSDDSHRNFPDRDRYLKLFAGAAGHERVGEASVWYLSSKAALPNILEDCPEARFIVMIRNPVDMAVSLHQQNLYGQYEDIADFGEAWDKQADRRAGKCIPKTCRDARHLQYGEACLLGSQVARVLARVPSNRVLFITLDELKSDPRAVYRTTLEFLEVADDDRKEFGAKNPSTKVRSKHLMRLIRMGVMLKYRLGITRSFGVHKLNRVKADWLPLDEHRKAELQQFFRDDIDLLEAQTGKDLSQWKTGSS